MSTDDLSSGLEERVRRLVELREQEEKKYGELLTLLDQISSFSLPHEQDVRFPELKEALNRIWDIQDDAVSELRKEDGFFWKDVARHVEGYLRPLIRQQREVNSLLAHIWNDYMDSVARSLQEIREFHHTLILYFQRIVPVLDTKYREAVGISENFHAGLKDSLELLVQDISKKVESIRMDLEVLSSLQTTVRSLHHLVNTQAGERKTMPERVGTHLRNLEIDTLLTQQGDRQVDRFASYVPCFENAPGTVTDLTCGYGAFLKLMHEVSIPVTGVDGSATAVEYCRNRGMEAIHSDPLEYLQSRQENSLGGIFSSGLVQCLEPDDLLLLLRLAHSRLLPGAPILVETINTASAAAFFSEFTSDLKNRTPLQPDSLKLLMAATGFLEPRIIHNRPVPATEKLRLWEGGSSAEWAVFNENMSRLNRLLFADQAFAVFARK